MENCSNSDISFLLLNIVSPFPTSVIFADVILKVWEFPACFFKSFCGNSLSWWCICQLENRGTITMLLGFMSSTFLFKLVKEPISFAMPEVYHSG